MFALLDKIHTLETKYCLLDPASIGRDDVYGTQNMAPMPIM